MSRFGKGRGERRSLIQLAGEHLEFPLDRCSFLFRERAPLQLVFELFQQLGGLGEVALLDRLCGVARKLTLPPGLKVSRHREALFQLFTPHIQLVLHIGHFGHGLLIAQLGVRDLLGEGFQFAFHLLDHRRLAQLRGLTDLIGELLESPRRLLARLDFHGMIVALLLVLGQKVHGRKKKPSRGQDGRRAHGPPHFLLELHPESSAGTNRLGRSSRVLEDG